jgi:hypothetical protein
MGLRDEKGKFKEGNQGFWLGKKRPEIHKWMHSNSASKKRIKTMTGRKLPKEQVEKMKKTKTGMHIWNGNRPEMRKWVVGKKNCNWKGGVTKIDKLCRRFPEYLQWRSNIFQRDNWTCQTCGIRGVYLEAHHIKSFSKILKENKIKSTKQARACNELWNLYNGITLCLNCHKLTFNYKGK